MAISALKVFKKKNSSYQAWHEEIGYNSTDSLIETVEEDDHRTQRTPTISEESDCATMYGSLADEEQVLLECFYLGSFSMAGRRVTGKGCIDQPAAQIWRYTQEECKSTRRRANTMPLEFIECKPKYIRLVVGKEGLKVVDQYSEQVLLSFSYRWISFTGTHPKYTRMFCFNAWEPKNKTPYCHAFKCEDSASAKTAALELSQVFNRKCRELLTQSSCSDASSSPRHILRKTLSLQQC